MVAEPLSRHTTLRQLAGRVRARFLLRVVRRGTLIAIGGAAAISIVGRLAAVEAWPAAALAWSAVVLVAALSFALVRMPTDWAVAREADALGLAERVSSALHARRIGASAADLVALDAHAALDGLDPRRYPVLDGPRAWRTIGVAALLLALLVIAPIPRFGQSSDGQDAQRVTVAQQRVQALELQAPTDTARPTDLDARRQQELQALRDALARSTTSQQAARAIEQSQQQLTRLASTDDYAARRTSDAVAQALESQPDDVLIPLAQALRAHDAQAVDRALADLSSRNLSNADQVALQAAANAASATQPQLAGALRRAATSSQQGALSDQELRNLLSHDAANASALDRLDQSLSALGQLRAVTLPAGATIVPATGTPTAYALVGGTPPPNATPVGLGLAANSPNSTRGDGAQNLGGPPGSGAAPNDTTPYDPVYAPTHLGGDQGQQVQIGADTSNARGDSVDLPQGPVSTGDVRPYDQVYARYAEEARQAAARQALPPNVQGLVDRYFGAIAPTPGATANGP